MAKEITPPVPITSDRMPPFSDEAERAVLGAALLDPNRVIDLCVERRVLPESFYIPKHQLIFQVLLEMGQESQPIDSLTLAERLRAKGIIEQIGGLEYINTLIDGTPTSAHAEYYATLVHNKHVLRAIIQRAREAIDLCYLEDDDAANILGSVEQSIFEISQDQVSSHAPWLQLVTEAMQDIEEIYQTKRSYSGLSSGYADLDSKLQGFKPAEMIILAARPSMGKTSLALNIAEHVASVTREDPVARPVAVFSLEMSSDQLVRRMLCSHARVPSHKLWGGYIGEVNHGELMNAADALSKAPIFIDDTAGLDVVELRSRARRMKRKHNIEFIVIDYLQMLHCSKYSREGLQRETAAISSGLKTMAKELQLPVMVLSQLSRAPETRGSGVPKLSDLRDSGSIEQDADVVCMLRRPCKYPGDEHENDKSLAVLHVAKNRNGPTGHIELNFEEEYTRFDTRSLGVDPLEPADLDAEFEL